MKQLRPRTILAVGLPVSLLLSVAMPAFVFCSNPSFQDWPMGPTVIAGSVWLFVCVPILLGMAFIRYRIGKLHQKQLKIEAAIDYSTLCFTVAAAATGGAYLTQDLWIYGWPAIALAQILAGTICAALFIVTGINIVIRMSLDQNERMVSRSRPKPRNAK